MKIPILNSIYADSGPDLRTGYPVNLVPVAVESGINSGYLRPGDGLVEIGTGPGLDRGGINWNGEHYRVLGTKLCKIDQVGTISVLGDVGTSGRVKFDYSFDRLAIASGGSLYYWNSGSLTQVTDVDLGNVLDVVWVDGYFMTTDGSYLVVTELNDPTSVNPLKYGSSEADPDPVVALKKIRNEVYAVNRYTIEVFDDVGGDLFPFARIEGAQVPKGAVGTNAVCTFMGGLAFLGSGRNESIGVFMAGNSSAQRISNPEIDQILVSYAETTLATCIVESRNENGRESLYIHLPDRTLVYDAATSQALQGAVWYSLISSLTATGQYRARNFVWCYEKWNCGDTQTAKIGYLSSSVSSHWGEEVRWEFGTSILYNESRGAIINQLELVALTGRVALGTYPLISTSYSIDGVEWSTDRMIPVGTTGNRIKRLVWFQLGMFRNWRVQRFQGTSDAHVSFARLEAQLEPLGN